MLHCAHLRMGRIAMRPYIRLGVRSSVNGKGLLADSQRHGNFPSMLPPDSPQPLSPQTRGDAGFFFGVAGDKRIKVVGASPA